MDRDTTIPSEIKAVFEFEKVISRLKNNQIEAGQIFELSQKPNKAELKLITSIGEREAAVLHLPNGNHWFIVSGEEDYVIPDQKLEQAADLCAHHHPPQTICAGLPHFKDVFYATSSGKKEFILHTKGITYYKGAKTDPISGEAWNPKMNGEVENKFFAFLETQGRTANFSEFEQF